MAVLNDVAAVPNRIIDAIDNVVESGVKEQFDIHLTLFGREIGIKVEVALLHKTTPPKPPTAVQ